MMSHDPSDTGISKLEHRVSCSKLLSELNKAREDIVGILDDGILEINNSSLTVDGKTFGVKFLNELKKNFEMPIFLEVAEDMRNNAMKFRIFFGTYTTKSVVLIIAKELRADPAPIEDHSALKEMIFRKTQTIYTTAAKPFEESYRALIDEAKKYEAKLGAVSEEHEEKKYSRK